MKCSISVPVVLSLLLAIPQTVLAQQFLRSVDELEDPRGYCLDIPGFGPTMQIDAPTYTHSCKYSLPGFDIDELLVSDDGRLRFVNFDRCLAADPIGVGANVYTVACDRAHAWRVHDSGRVTPASATDLCLTLSATRTFVRTGFGTVPPYSSRAVTLEDCAVEAAFRQRWRWTAPNEHTTYNANSLRSGISREIQQRNAALGSVIDPRATAALYRDAIRQFGPGDVTVSEVIAYGREDGQRLQIYEGKNRNPSGGSAPVVVLVHGGGFGGGSLASLAHVATQFAGLGFVAVNMTYPLAPEHTWPSGAESVAVAVDWVAAQISTYRGDPERVFLLGHSAGASHVADYVLRPSLSTGRPARVAGAVLASPWFELDPSGPADNYAAYFDVRGRDWSLIPLLTNIEDASTPLLITIAQYDPQPFFKGTARLYARLVDEFGAKPRLRQIPGHGHISYITAVGTADTLFVEEALDFMLDSPR